MRRYNIFINIILFFNFTMILLETRYYLFKSFISGKLSKKDVKESITKESYLPKTAVKEPTSPVSKKNSSKMLQKEVQTVNLFSSNSFQPSISNTNVVKASILTQVPQLHVLKEIPSITPIETKKDVLSAPTSHLLNIVHPPPHQTQPPKIQRVEQSQSHLPSHSFALPTHAQYYTLSSQPGLLKDIQFSIF